MPLIDTTYFDGELELVGFNMASITTAVNVAIERYQTEYLDKVLGTAFAELFLYGLDHPTGGALSNAFSSAFNIGGISQRWKWLRDGKVFDLADGRSVRWQGFRNARKLSPLANYTYFWYRRNNATKPTQSGGEVKAKKENSSPAPIDMKLVRAWNQMVEWNLQLHCLLSTAKGLDGRLYPEYNERYVDAELFRKINPFGI